MSSHLFLFRSHFENRFLKIEKALLKLPHESGASIFLYGRRCAGRGLFSVCCLKSF